MGLKEVTSNLPSAQSKNAEGFGNLSFTDAKGKQYRLPKGVALDSSNPLTKWILEQAKQDPEFSLTLTMRVQLVGESNFEAPEL